MVQTQVTKHVARLGATQLEVDVVEYPMTVLAMLAANPDALVRGAAAGLAQNTGGALLLEEEAEVGGQPGLHVKTGYPDGEGESYLVFYAGRLYRVRALQRGETGDAGATPAQRERFFSSFELRAPRAAEEAGP
jgi:hypothetical protein